MSATTIHPAMSADAAAVQAIYAFHVAHGTATFDTVAPSEIAWRDKISNLAERGWPFLITRHDDIVVGYAYATQFRDRAAYAATCENSIYLSAEFHRRGVGTALLTALMAAARCCGFEQMIAVIGGAEPASVALHGKLGFAEVGRLRQVGCKFGRRLDTVYMQAGLAEPPGIAGAVSLTTPPRSC